MLGLFQQFGPPEIIIILFLALLLFGAKRLPEIGKGLGKGIKEFKSGVKGLTDDADPGLSEDAAADRKAAPRAESPTRKDAAD